jgi:hypothetical protein
MIVLGLLGVACALRPQDKGNHLWARRHIGRPLWALIEDNSENIFYLSDLSYGSVSKQKGEILQRKSLSPLCQPALDGTALCPEGAGLSLLRMPSMAKSYLRINKDFRDQIHLYRGTINPEGTDVLLFEHGFLHLDNQTFSPIREGFKLVRAAENGNFYVLNKEGKHCTMKPDGRLSECGDRPERQAEWVSKKQKLKV